MSEQSGKNTEPLTPELDKVCDRFEAAWKAAASPDERPRIEDYLEGAAEAERPARFQELVAREGDYRRRHGEEPAADEYRRRFPALDPTFLAETFAAPPPAALGPSPQAWQPQTNGPAEQAPPP